MIYLISFLCPSQCYFPLIFPTTSTSYSYPLSLHDALPIFQLPPALVDRHDRYVLKERIDADGNVLIEPAVADIDKVVEDRKSTRLNSSHVAISYAVFCLKKKNNNESIRHLVSHEEDNSSIT